MAFFDQCYELLKQVPEGKVVTYKQIAEALGSKAYRHVGMAMAKNPNAPQVPCHRVVGVSGALTGYAYGLDKKEALLRQENIEVKDGHVDLSRYQYQFNQ